MSHVERKLLDQFVLHCANNPVLDVTFLHEQEGRHRLDTELLSNGLLRKSNLLGKHTKEETRKLYYDNLQR